MRQVALVAGRELHETFRSRAYWVTMAVLLLGVVAVIALPRVFAADTQWELAVVGEPPTGLEQDVELLAGAFDTEVQLVRLATRADAERAVAGDEVDAALVYETGETAIVRRAATAETLVGLASQAAAAAAVRGRLTEAGLERGAVEEVLAAPPPQEVVVDEEQPARSIVAFAVSFVLYIALIVGGGAVATGVGVEKSSRIAEVLVTTLRPSQLMAGKVLGIGTSTLLLLLAAAVPFTLAASTGLVDVPAAAVRDVLGGLGWFLLGFSLYATSFAALGALIDRQEDVTAAVGPVTGALILSLMAGIHAQGSPNSLLAQATSLFPFSAPLVMPVRIAEGAASAGEIAAAIAIGLLTLAAVVYLGGIVYRRALLRGGRRLRLVEVLRG